MFEGAPKECNGCLDEFKQQLRQSLISNAELTENQLYADVLKKTENESPEVKKWLRNMVDFYIKKAVGQYMHYLLEDLQLITTEG